MMRVVNRNCQWMYSINDSWKKKNYFSIHLVGGRIEKKNPSILYIVNDASVKLQLFIYSSITN